jgi:hypothetical protein
MTRKLSITHNSTCLTDQEHVEHDVRVGATLGGVVAFVPGSRSQFIARQPNLGPC